MATKKQLEARKLREQGLTQAEIGRRLGISLSTVRERLHGSTRGSDTTQIGYLNKNRQRVIEKTDERSPTNLQFVYILKCEDCGHEYGSYGGDNHQRRCPQCQRLDAGAPAEGPPIARS